MCGIAGIVDLGGGRPAQRWELESMVARLRNRGPDGVGYYLGDGVGLGHARLSIVDLESGQQPIRNEDHSVWCVFNGEIFNYVELRAELIERGHRFYTRSDTEVIVHLYEEYGEEFVHRLNGQFAIALWDAAERKLLLLRDRPGILPLYFTRDGGRLLFASEVKALLPLLETPPELDLGALDQIFTFWAPLSPNTVFRGVQEVGPGEMVRVAQGRVIRRRYWDWDFPVEPAEYWQESEQTLAERLRELLADATRLRLRADVPVGAYLSGGLDSSSLTALACRQVETPLLTFSIGFEERALDEADFQRAMSAHLGTAHTSVHCRNEDVGAAFLETIARTETPILRTAPVPMALLSARVRAQGCKAVLTGEGADEVLGGYDLFKEGKIRQFWARRPDSRWRPLLLKRLYPYLDISRQGVVYLRQFFGRGLEQHDAPWFAHIPRWSTTSLCKEFFAPDLAAQLRHRDPLAELEAALPPSIRRWHPFNQSQYIEAKLLMAGYLLCSQGDRMLMAHSVEGRFPFLDHRLIEFANRLPPRLKMRGLCEKYLLKRAMAPYLPTAIVERHKQPYRAPDIAAFFGAAAPPDYVDELMGRAAIARYGYFDPDRVERLLAKIRRGRAVGYKDNMAFVGILSTQAWHRIFVEGFRSTFKSGHGQPAIAQSSALGG